MNQLRSRQRRLFIAFLVIEAVFIGLAIGVFFTPWSFDGKMAAITGVLFCGLLAALWFHPRLFYYAQMYGFARLRAEAAPAIATSRDLTSPDYVAFLKSKGFSVFVDTRDFTLLHRTAKDPTNLLRRATMLDIIVLIRSSRTGYDDPGIAAAINKLENDYVAKKTRLQNYAIIEVKAGGAIDAATKEAVDQVTFEKQGKNGIANLNVHYDADGRSAYFLHSDTYAPSAFFRYAVDMFKSTL